MCLQFDFKCLLLVCLVHNKELVVKALIQSNSFISCLYFVGKVWQCTTIHRHAHRENTSSVQQRAIQQSNHQVSTWPSRSLIQAFNLTSLALALCFQQTNNKRDFKLHCLQYGLGGSRKQTSERLQKAAEMPFIRS